MTTPALLIIGCQNDLCEGGTHPVQGGTDCVTRVARHLLEHRRDYLVVNAVKCWHPKDWQELREFTHLREAPYCVAGTPGADWHPNLEPALRLIDRTFYMGQFGAAHSGFQGRAEQNGSGMTLAQHLATNNVVDLDIVGIATDYWVKATAMDAARFGFNTKVHIDLTEAVEPRDIKRTIEALEGVGVEVV